MTDLRELRRLEPWFFRAPSAHNTQPWVLTYERDRIELGFDPARSLPAGDPTRRDLFLSLGCFVEGVLVAAAAEAIPLEFRLEERMFVRGAGMHRTDFMPNDLERRQTSRLPYSGRLPKDALAASRAQLRDGDELHELSSAEIRPLFAAADRHLYESPAVVDELRSWLRLTKRDPRYDQDGLTYECLALSPFEARVLALLLDPRVYPVVRALRLQRLFTGAAEGVLDGDGTVLVLEGPADGPAELIESGRSLMRIWLALARAGFATHPLSQILDCEATARELAERVGAGPGRRLLCVFRAGRSEPAPRSHRLVER